MAHDIRVSDLSEPLPFPSPDADEIFSFPEQPVPPPVVATGGIYEQIIRHVFFTYHREGETAFDFVRDEINGAALGLSPKNLGDIIYSYRSRRPLPPDIRSTAPEGFAWMIEGTGQGRYRFRVVRDSWFLPNPALPVVEMVDHTPEEVMESGRRDEQAILASIQYNRLLDLFLHCRLERKQGHWRTNVSGVGQVEIDDVYVGNDQDGVPVVVTVQAKRDRDRVNSVQIMQDIRACQERGDGRLCRPVAVHHDGASERMTFFEFADTSGEVRLVREVQYRLRRRLVVG